MLIVNKGEGMELPKSKRQQEFADEIKVIEANLKDISGGTAPPELSQYSQTKLDQLAERFQNDEHLGTARYKLYELQALLYFFQHRDADALDFIHHAVEVRGSNYPKAEKIETMIEERGDFTVASAAYDEPPLELQAIIRSVHTSAIIMVVISIISIYFIPWAIFYIVLATKLKSNQVPNRTLVMWAGIATLPLCLGLIPILIDIEFWTLNRKLKNYEEQGAGAFMSNQEWLAGEPKRRRSRRIATIALLSIVGIFILLLLIAVLSSGS